MTNNQPQLPNFPTLRYNSFDFVPPLNPPHRGEVELEPSPPVREADVGG